MNVYRYTLPSDGIYHLTARKMRTYDRSLQQQIKNEIIQTPPSLLHVCRLVYQELWPMIYKKCVFYITIYSIGDLLYTLDLLDRYAHTTTLHSTDIFYHMRNIRIRIDDLILNIRPLQHSWRMTVGFSQTTQLWSGPGTSLLYDRAQAAALVRGLQGHKIVAYCFDAESLEKLLRFMLAIDALDKHVLIKVLPWYQRRQSRHKSSMSSV